eukprot:scaffold14614_cov115-Amphora_coffeaeformis.AAC.1
MAPITAATSFRTLCILLIALPSPFTPSPLPLPSQQHPPLTFLSPPTTSPSTPSPFQAFYPQPTDRSSLLPSCPVDLRRRRRPIPNWRPIPSTQVTVGFRLSVEDEGHAGLGPVGFEEGGERAIITAEERIQQEGGFEGVESLQEVGGPGQKGNRFAMIGADEGAEGSDTGFEVGDEAGVEVEEADEGMEGLAAGGYGPVADGVVLGGGRAVTIRVEVIANPFDAVEEEVAFLGVEGEAPFGKDVVDNLVVAGLDEVDKYGGGVDVREPGAEEGLPFLAHEEHEGCVAGGGVHWAKGHDVEGEEGAVWAGEAELLAVAVSDGDLVEAGLGINTDPV